MTHTDGWSWFDAPELSDVDLSDHDVTAVLVCRNAGSWLNATLAGIGQLDRRPDVILAVDNQSTDDTAELLESAYQAGLVDQVVPGRATFSFGEAVERALSLVEAPTRWIWLLHDDAVPDHDALTELLMLAVRTPRLAMAVPLLVRPARRNHAARTLEIGASISDSGRRVLGLEPDEVAQGQYESASVLGGSTCGMLVRWESLIEVGGFDPCISSYRDGVDLGWRAQLIDQWVLTCPTARIVHRQAGRSEIRPGTIASQAGRREAAWDRLMGLRLVAAHAHGIGKLTHLVYLTLVCWLGALGYLLGRAPDHAKDEMQAWADFMFRSRRPVIRLRKKIAAISQGNDTRYRVRTLRPSLGTVVADGLQAFVRWFRDQFASRRDAEMTLDDLLGDEFTRRIGEGRKRIPVGVWLVVVVIGVAIMARNLYRVGIVTASGLLGPPQSWSQAFQMALSPTGRSSPWLLISAAASVLSIRPEWFPVVVLIGAFPLTMLVAVWYAKKRIQHGALRWLAAAGYACLPILMGGLNAGALWLVAGAMLLPFLAEWLSRLGVPWAGARSLQGLAGIVISGVFLLALLPVLWLPVMAVALAVAIRGSGVAGAIRTGVALVLPVAFWAQAIPSYIAEPARLLLTPVPLVTSPGVMWQMLFGRPIGVGLPPLWVSLAVFSALWLAGLVVALQSSKHRFILLPGLAAIGAGMWLAHLVLPLGPDSVRPDPSLWLLVGFAVLLYAFVSWADDIMGSLEGRDFGGTQALVAGLSFLLIAVFIISVGWSALAGMNQVHRGSDSQIPSYLAQNEIDFDTATLIINADTGTWNLRNSGQTFWDEGSVRSGPASSPTAAATLEQIVARAISARPDDTIASDLATFGVSTVVVLDPSQETMTALDTVAGFQRTTTGGVVEIWSVAVNSASPTRRSLVATGTLPTYLGAEDEVPPGSARTLVLATPPDPDLHVLVGGVEVRPTISGDWRAAFSLGTASGPIQLQRTIEHEWFAWLQLGAVVVLIVFVFPPLVEETRTPDRPRYQMRNVR